MSALQSISLKAFQAFHHDMMLLQQGPWYQVDMMQPLTSLQITCNACSTVDQQQCMPHRAVPLACFI
jgi:hypothetical protein